GRAQLPGDRQARSRAERLAASHRSQRGHLRGARRRRADDVRTCDHASARAAVLPVLSVPLLKSLPVADAVYREHTLPHDSRSYQRDTITLGWEHRLKARARRKTDNGTDFATALPRGTVLRQDDLLILPALRLVVRIVEDLEPVLIVRPETP